MEQQKYIPSCSRLGLTFFSCFLLMSCNSLLMSSNHEKNEIVNTTSTIDQNITLAQVTKDVSFLASDELKGRGNFSPEIHLAADYIAKRFSEIGLSTFKNSPDFKQKYVVKRITPQKLAVQINGQAIKDERLAMVTSQEHFSWQLKVAKTSETLDNNMVQSKSDLHNNNDKPVNIVVIDEKTNMRKAIRALNKQGGQHLVLLHPKHEKSFKGYQKYFAKGLTKLTSDKDSNLISDTSSKNNHGIIVIALTDINEVTKYSVTGSADIQSTTLSNVVGVLPGRSKANEVVLFSAHYDHLGLESGNTDSAAHNAYSHSGDGIYNGADDNASGVSAVIALANHYKKLNNNERTLVFAAFNGEEIGGFGSQHFASKIEANSVTAMLNFEMIGKASVFGEGNVWMTGMDRSNLGEQLNHALLALDITVKEALKADPTKSTTEPLNRAKPTGLKIYSDPYPKQELFYRSDNASLARLGVPAHSFSSTQLDKDKHYHQVSDTINTLNLPSMLKVIRLMALATSPLVNGTITPTRINPKKVKNKGLIY